MEISTYELYEINGGAISFTGLNSICRFIDTFVSLGRMCGSAARKLFR
jgi:hypothetical protein